MYNNYIMRHKSLGFIGLMTVGLCVTSCNYINILSHKLKSIVISDSTSAYVVGDSFFNGESHFSIVGTYTNGEKENFNKNDVTFNLSLSGQSKDINSPFASEGNYKLTVSKDNVISNELTISVYSSSQYVSNIQVKGQNSIEVDKEVPLTLTVTSASSSGKYTVPILYESSDSSIVSISRNSETSYTIKGKSVGGADITFKALSDASHYVETVFRVSVVLSNKVKIEQTYADFIKYNYYNTSSCPTVGEVNLLVIPVWFSDSQTYVQTSYKDNIRSDISATFFGTKSETGWHSVKSFYEEESKGLLTLDGLVSEWYTPNVTSAQASNYTNQNQATFVKNAVNWYFNNHSDSRTRYDFDGDGFLDGVMLIYAAPDYQVFSAFTSNMWAYCYYVQDLSLKNPSNPGVNGFFWASYDFMYGANKVYSRTGSSYHNGDTSHCNLDGHTFIHEMGHMFGLEDYYDYSKATSPTAGFSMQDNNVGGHDPFSTMAYGWSNPYIPTESCEITINDFQSSHDIILLTPNWNNYNSPFDEYLLLELYTPTGLNKFDSDYRYNVNYPKGPSSVGIRLWHVDARLFNKKNYKLTTDVFASNGNIYTAFNNTYRNSTEDPDYGRNSFSYDFTHSEDYQRFNLLHLIRQNKNIAYDSTTDLTDSDLFFKNNAFDMNSYKTQFYKNNGLLDSGEALGWSFSVMNISSVSDGIYSATINLVKA